MRSPASRRRTSWRSTSHVCLRRDIRKPGAPAARSVPWGRDGELPQPVHRDPVDRVVVVLAMLVRNAKRCALRVAPGGCARCGAKAPQLCTPLCAPVGALGPGERVVGYDKESAMLRIYAVALEMVG